MIASLVAASLIPAMPANADRITDPFCFIELRGRIIDLSYMCNPPAIVEAITPAEPDYVTRARETIANPNSDGSSINKARIILNAYESRLLSQEQLFWQGIKDGQ
ncbi:hypothetical protein HCU40_19520 (plasmid) [Pseudanabaena biceps]|nr:hypothetical protein [Pseudanabaena biceps]